METEKNSGKTLANQKIKVTKNGPYLVSGGVQLSEQNTCVDPDQQCHGWKEGKKFPSQENYALCRCGQSQNKPYCDGSHMRVQFNGTETTSDIPYLEQAKVFNGPDLKLTDAEGLCASARFCERAGNAWTLAEKSGDPEARKTAIEEAAECPSGRLITWDKDGKPIEPHFDPSIGLVHDTQYDKMGPIWVRGGIAVESAEGQTYEVRNKATLCRCGKSANKPFCDGSHLK
jgi:CDGSH-type Zn-finger protein